jgi:hypothetical protein
VTDPLEAFRYRKGFRRYWLDEEALAQFIQDLLNANDHLENEVIQLTNDVAEGCRHEF